MALTQIKHIVLAFKFRCLIHLYVCMHESPQLSAQTSLRNSVCLRKQTLCKLIEKGRSANLFVCFEGNEDLYTADYCIRNSFSFSLCFNALFNLAEMSIVKDDETFHFSWQKKNCYTQDDCQAGSEIWHVVLVTTLNSDVLHTVSPSQ